MSSRHTYTRRRIISGLRNVTSPQNAVGNNSVRKFRPILYDDGILLCKTPIVRLNRPSSTRTLITAMLLFPANDNLPPGPSNKKSTRFSRIFAVVPLLLSLSIKIVSIVRGNLRRESVIRSYRYVYTRTYHDRNNNPIKKEKKGKTVSLSLEI